MLKLRTIGIHDYVVLEGRQRRPYRMNTRVSSAVETSVYVLATVMTPRYSRSILPVLPVLQSRQTALH
jgi:hypothetical protein